ncbi:MAG TPA: exodeoxyribonuclease VII small subunit [Cytophagales bacterium]|nr:exodeoxyribonuclease VII small subunit [Cytophagales bacterium]
MAKKDKELTYQTAYAELEQIVQQIETEEPDVDHLGTLVKRAAELLAFCKNRLRQTEQDVQSTLEGLDADE